MFIENSHPEHAAESALLAGDALRREVQASQVSNGKIAKAIGRSATMVSQYLNGKYEGDVQGLESRLREWLRDRTLSIVSGVATISTEISDAMERRFEGLRTAGELGVLIGEAGIGKSRGMARYLQQHSLPICFRVLPWNRSLLGIARTLLHAAEVNKIGRGEHLWDVVLDKMTESERLLIVDDAHELSPGGLQCVVDLHEETGMPVALVGLPALEAKLLRDMRRKRRVGDVCRLAVEDYAPLTQHMIRQLAPEANGETEDLTKLALQVAAKEGHFGDLEKALKKAARTVKRAGAGWPKAFLAADRQLLRTQPLA